MTPSLTCYCHQMNEPNKAVCRERRSPLCCARSFLGDALEQVAEL